MPPLKPLVIRELTPEEREARERALKEAKAAVKNGAQVGPLKKK
jgi:ribosomal protein L29